MSNYPKSPKEMVGGLFYFARMLDKMRLQAKGALGEDYQKNFGAAKAADGAMCAFLGVEHEAVRRRLAEGGTDDEILEWCYAQGQRPREIDVMLWNSFNSKLGYRDHLSPRIAQLKKDAGIPHRDDVVTAGDFIDWDEKRME